MDFMTRRTKGPNPFFRRPHIEINYLKPHSVNNVTLTSNEDRPEIFDVNVWTIRVKNKNYGPFSRNASKCRVELTLFKNGRDDDTFRLPWNDDALPPTCDYRDSLVDRNEYKSKLPFCYIGRLIHEQSNPTIPVGEERDIILACTFRELDALYIVSQKTIGENDVISVRFNASDNYSILLKFYSEEYKDAQGKNFKLKANSWNDVKLTRF